MRFLWFSIFGHIVVGYSKYECTRDERGACRRTYLSH